MNEQAFRLSPCRFPPLTGLFLFPDSLPHLLPPDSVYLQQRQMHQH